MSFAVDIPDDPDSFDLGLYVVGDSAPPPSDILSGYIDDSPEAAAAFDNFVTELNGTSIESQSGSTSQVSESVQTFQASSPSDTAFSSSAASRTITLASNGLPAAALSNQTNVDNVEENPDRLDFHSLGTSALPLNVAADATIHARAVRAQPFPALLPDADTLAAHLSLPLNPRPWGAPISNVPRARDALMSRVSPPQQSAAARGRPRVREMRHVPERNSTVGASGGVPSNSNSPAKLRYSKGAAPSKYCHVCGRSAKTVSVALCGNNRLGLCRKVVCDKCLLMHQRDSWEVAKRGDGNWICMHCRNSCPERARCHQYQRNNLKRRMRGAGAPSASQTAPRRPATGRVVRGNRKAKLHSVATVATPTTSASLMTPLGNGPNGAEPGELGPPHALIGNGLASLRGVTESSIPGRNVSGMQVAEMTEIGGRFVRSPPEGSINGTSSVNNARKVEADQVINNVNIFANDVKPKVEVAVIGDSNQSEVLMPKANVKFSGEAENTKEAENVAHRQSHALDSIQQSNVFLPKECNHTK